MKYLLDTDHLSVVQRQTGQSYTNLIFRIQQYPLSEFAVSVITFHEQLLGWHTDINKSKTPEKIVKGYDRLVKLLENFQQLPLLPFDNAASNQFSTLQSQNLRLGTMDLRIASIALSRNLTVLTRNSQDFEKVPNLHIDDWTRQL